MFAGETLANILACFQLDPETSSDDSSETSNDGERGSPDASSADGDEDNDTNEEVAESDDEDEDYTYDREEVLADPTKYLRKARRIFNANDENLEHLAPAPDQTHADLYEPSEEPEEPEELRGEDGTGEKGTKASGGGGVEGEEPTAHLAIQAAGIPRLCAVSEGFQGIQTTLATEEESGGS